MGRMAFPTSLPETFVHQRNSTFPEKESGSGSAAEREEEEARHISGGALSAIRALRTATPSNYPVQCYGVARRELPFPLIELICEYISLKNLPKVQCLSVRFKQSLTNF